MSYTSTIVIQELTAPGGRSPRSLTLSGSGLPVMGAAWASESVIVTQWYPGNSEEATQQMLVSKLMPSTWKGEWHRTLLGDTPAQYTDSDGAPFEIVDPLVLFEICESLQRAGQRLRVTWAVDGPDASSTGKIVREGRLKKVDIAAHRIQDIDWTMEFDWMSRGGVTPKVTQTRTATIGIAYQEYAWRIQELIDANKHLPAGSSLTLGQLEAMANYPSKLADSMARQMQQLVSEGNQIVNIAAALASQPAEVANRAIDLANNTAAQANNFNDTLSAVPWEYQTTKNKLSDFVRASVTFAKKSDLAESAAIAGMNLARAMQTEYRPPLGIARNPTRVGGSQSQAGQEQIRITHAGDTPETLSARYYGNPDHGDVILRANKLPWHQGTFAAGKILVIPPLPTVSATNQV